MTPNEKAEEGWVPFDKLTKRQLITTAIALQDQRDRAIAALASTPSPAQPTAESFSVEVIYPEAEPTLTSESAQTGSGSWDKFDGHTPTKQAQHEPAPRTDAARNADANLHSSDSAEPSPQSQGRSRLTASTTTATGSDSSPSLAPSPAQPTEASGEDAHQSVVYIWGDRVRVGCKRHDWSVTMRNDPTLEQMRAEFNEHAPSPVQGADDRLARAEALVAHRSHWYGGGSIGWGLHCLCGELLELGGSPVPAGVEVGDYRLAQHQLAILAAYQQSPQAALNEVRAGE